MPKKTPNKYFVGQLDNPKRGLPFRIFRQRKSMLGTIIDEVCLKTGWKRMKTGYKRVGPFLKSQAELRASKRFWEGKGAR